ncbi:hypothetical protein GCM10010252_15880 [Streptomyces aureoverticillatus]|nr:hypothetical protein GCM10010252_15880 [Streptomyces aureoverticillatus]
MRGQKEDAVHVFVVHARTLQEFVELEYLPIGRFDGSAVHSRPLPRRRKGLRLHARTGFPAVA